MDWKKHYDARNVSADEAAAHIKSGDQIVVTHAAGEPRLLFEALVKRQKELRGVAIRHGLCFGPAVYCDESVDPDSIRHHGIFFGAKTRAAGIPGRASFIPAHFSSFPVALREGVIPIDVMFIHLSPPDRFGYCTTGISCDWERAGVDSAKLVIGEINTNMPRTYGETLVHVTELDYIVESSADVLTIPRAKIGPIEESIGKYIADLVPDGGCLQLGVGAIPDAIMSFLTEKNDLGLHSELIPESAMDLMKAGVINGKKKTLHPYKAIATFAAGSKEFYAWLHENPAIEFYPVDYVNDSRVIAKIDNMISVNAALQVDLMGQVNAEAINRNQYSGIGGQVDFVRGAVWAKGGKSIIALSATTKEDTISRIVPAIAPGDPVSTSRNDVDYIVTEYGVAHLRGQNLFERARRLIAVAHPKFRDELKEQFEKLFNRKLSNA